MPFAKTIDRLEAAMAELDELRAENKRLRAALEEIAGHMIDSEFASREKRAMAQRALNVERK